MTAQTGVPGVDLDIRDLRLVAVPRVRALGWSASVGEGLRHIATIVIEADPTVSGPPPRLLYFDRDTAEALTDPVGVTVLAEDPASDVLSDPVTAVAQSTRFNSAPLQGSILGEDVALGDERVVAYNGAGLDFMTLTALTPPQTAPDGIFLAPPGSDEFDVQNAYLAVQSMYAWTDRFMAERWDSLLGESSPFSPGTFSPRVMVYENTSSGCPEGAVFCAGRTPVIGLPGQIPQEYEQPLGGPLFETLGHIVLGQAVHGPDIIGHEFGHFVDLFANPGIIREGFTCEDCTPQCKPDTTDESAPLTETFANLAAMWYLRDLYDIGQSPTECAVPRAVSLGGNRGPHVEGCLDNSRVALFLAPDGCPAGFGCDGFQESDASTKSGICNPSRGYRIDSFHQAIWEAMHSQTCAVDPPHTCESRPELHTEPAGDLVGGALLFALRVDSASYRGFADDMATNVACNHGESAYEAFNEILCHHRIRDCDAPTPVICKTCGNDIVELDEGCDGNDLGGKDCVDLGFSGGALMCNASCILDDSNCLLDLPTTGADSDIPTGTGGGGSHGDSAGGGEGAEDGCSCKASGGSEAWPALLLVGLLGRRRRRAIVAASVLLLGPSACSDSTSTDLDTSGGAETEGSSGETDGFGDISRRMFGEFHSDNVAVGYVNADKETLFFRVNLHISSDGSLSTHRSVCEGTPSVQDFTWIQVGEDELQVVPEEYAPDGTFQFMADRILSARLRPGDGCDDVVVLTEYPPDSGQSSLSSRWIPGDICAKPLGELCYYELVWCDGAAPPMCVEGQ